MDSAAFLLRWLRDVRDEQYENGLVPMVVPNPFSNRKKTLFNIIKNMIFRRKGDEKGLIDEYMAVFQMNSSVGWGDAGVVVPWTLFQFYNDKKILEESYDSMRAMFNYRFSQTGKMIDFIRFMPYLLKLDSWQHIQNFTSDWFGFGDWLAPKDGMNGSILKSRNYIPQAYLAYSANIMAKTAQVLGQTQESEKYRNYFENFKKSFQYFFLKEDGSLRINRQTAYVLSLAFDLVPEEFKSLLAARLAEMVAADNYKVDTGFLGTPHLCQVLTEFGYVDHAYKLVLNEDHQWLYQVKSGATTVWEHWNNIKADGNFTSERMLSFNHYAPGAIGAWLYQSVAGIRQASDQAGFSHIIIAPKLGGNLRYASAKYDSIRGLISCEWKIIDEVFYLEINIPVGAEAKVMIPLPFSKNIKYQKGFIDLPLEGFSVGSGIHQFSAELSS